MTGGSYESKLLRLLVGYFHVSLMQQTALTRHAKPLHQLTPEEKSQLEEELTAAVAYVANYLSEEFFSGNLTPPPTVN